MLANGLNSHPEQAASPRASRSLRESCLTSASATPGVGMGRAGCGAGIRPADCENGKSQKWGKPQVDQRHLMRRLVSFPLFLGGKRCGDRVKPLRAAVPLLPGCGMLLCGRGRGCFKQHCLLAVKQAVSLQWWKNGFFSHFILILHLELNILLHNHENVSSVSDHFPPAQIFYFCSVIISFK